MAEPQVAPLTQPDPTDPRFAADPESVYGPIRERAPVWWWEEARGWLVTGHAHQVTVFLEDPSVRANAVLELLRVGTGLQIERFARRDFEISSVPIRKGQMVVASSYAAHHDPAVFPNPKSLDLRRDLKELAVFGGGRHFCLGTQLAKLELQIAYSTLIDGLPGLRLAVPDTDLEIACDNRRSIVSLPLEFDVA